MPEVDIRVAQNSQKTASCRIDTCHPHVADHRNVPPQTIPEIAAGRQIRVLPCCGMRGGKSQGLGSDYIARYRTAALYHAARHADFLPAKVSSGRIVRRVCDTVRPT